MAYCVYYETLLARTSRSRSLKVVIVKFCTTRKVCKYWYAHVLADGALSGNNVLTCSVDKPCIVSYTNSLVGLLQNLNDR